MRIGTTDDLFISEPAKALHEIWLSLPREENQLFPKRFELDFSSLPDGLRQHVFLLSNLGENVVSASEIGSAITAFLGEKIDGQNLVQRHGPGQMQYELPYYKAVFGQPCAGSMKRRTVNQAGTHADFISCHLPMLDYQNQANYMLGVASIINVEAADENFSAVKFDQSEILDRILVDVGGGNPNIL